MAKGTAVKITKVFGQRSAHIQNVANVVQQIVDAGCTIVSILKASTNTVEIVHVKEIEG